MRYYYRRYSYGFTFCRLLNLPNTNAESFAEEENEIILKLRFLHDEIPSVNVTGILDWQHPS